MVWNRQYVSSENNKRVNTSSCGLVATNPYKCGVYTWMRSRKKFTAEQRTRFHVKFGIDRCLLPYQLFHLIAFAINFDLTHNGKCCVRLVSFMILTWHFAPIYGLRFTDFSEPFQTPKPHGKYCIQSSGNEQNTLFVQFMILKPKQICAFDFTNCFSSCPTFLFGFHAINQPIFFLLFYNEIKTKQQEQPHTAKSFSLHFNRF